MPHYFEDDCPGCRRRLRIRTEYRGRSITCNHCRRPFLARPDGEGASGGEATAPDAGAIVGGPREGHAPDDAVARGLRADLAARDAALTEAARQLDEARGQLERLEASARDWQGRLDREAEARRLEVEQARGLEGERDRLREQARGLEGERDRLREQARGLRDRVDRLEAEAGRAGLLAGELEAAIAERDRLEAEAGRAGLLAGELEAAIAERDRLDLERRGRADEVEGLRAELREEGRLRRATEAEHRASFGALACEFREAVGRSEADRLEARDRLRDREAEIADARRRGLEGRSRAAVACRRLRGRLAAAEAWARRGSEADRDEADRLREEIRAAIRSRDELRDGVEAIARERDRLLGLLDRADERARGLEADLGDRLRRAEQAARETEHHHRDERIGLSAALDEARGRAAEATGRADGLEALVGRLRSEVDELRRAGEADRLEHRRQVEALREGREAERAAWADRLDAAAGRSESELRALREELERWRGEAADLRRGNEALRRRVDAGDRGRVEPSRRPDARLAAPPAADRRPAPGEAHPAGVLALPAPRPPGIAVMSLDDVLDTLVPGPVGGMAGESPGPAGPSGRRASPGAGPIDGPARRPIASTAGPRAADGRATRPTSGLAPPPGAASFSMYSRLVEFGAGPGRVDPDGWTGRGSWFRRALRLIGPGRGEADPG